MKAGYVVTLMLLFVMGCTQELKQAAVERQSMVASDPPDVNGLPTDQIGLEALAHLQYLQNAKDSVYTLRIGGTINIPITGQQVYTVSFLKVKNDTLKIAGFSEVQRKLTLRMAYNDTARYGVLPRPAPHILADTTDHLYSPYAASVGEFCRLGSPWVWQRYGIEMHAWVTKIAGTGTSVSASTKNPVTLTIRIVKAKWPWRVATPAYDNIVQAASLKSEPYEMWTPTGRTTDRPRATRQ